jgi:hypothetical protein
MLAKKIFLSTGLRMRRAIKPLKSQISYPSKLSIIRKVALALLLTLTSSIPFMGKEALADEIIDQSNPSYSYTYSLNYNGMGQTFVANQTGNLTKVSIPIQKNSYYGTSSPDLVVDIYSSPDLSNSATKLLGKASVPFDSVSSTGVTWTDLTFESPIPVVAGQQYFLAVPSQEDYYYSAYSIGYGYDTYNQGNLYLIGGQSTYQYQSLDLGFKTYVEADPSIHATTFQFTGNVQDWVVPNGVTSVSIKAYGASGGSDTQPGGRGGFASGDLAVTPGETLHLYIGGRGNDCTSGAGGGYNGGGNAGPSGCSGGGGGATDVRVNDTAISNRVIVAGGGGGAGLYGSGSAGGNQIYSGNLYAGGNHPGDGGGGGGGYYGGSYGSGDSGGQGGSSYTSGVSNESQSAGVNNGNGYIVLMWKISDTNPPTTTSSVSGTQGTNSWYTTDTNVTLVATDDQSGVEKTEFSLDNGSSWQAYSSPISIQSEGRNTVLYHSVDKAGNIESNQTIFVHIDKAAPISSKSVIGTSGNNGWFTSDVQVELTATDASSGLATTEYSLDNGHSWNTYSHAFTVSTEGQNTVLYRSVDQAGNVEPSQSITINIDKTAPTLELSLNTNTLFSPNHKMVDIDVKVTSDDLISGINQVKLISITSNQADNGVGDGNTTNDIQGADYGTHDTNFQLRAERSGNGDRIYTITYEVTDNAGNQTTQVATVTVLKDQGNKKK